MSRRRGDIDSHSDEASNVESQAGGDENSPKSSEGVRNRPGISIRTSMTKSPGPKATPMTRRSSQLLSSNRRIRQRLVAEQKPEVHIIGEVKGGSGFGSGVFAKWVLESGENWKVLVGDSEGQTHVDYPSDGNDVVWAHPIDLHLATNSPQGWPRILVRVYQLDTFGACHMIATGFTHIPMSAGSFEVNCPTWRPAGTVYEDLKSFFLGGSTCLKAEHQDKILFDTAWHERYRLVTVPSGNVHFTFDVVLRYFNQQALEWG